MNELQLKTKLEVFERTFLKNSIKQCRLVLTKNASPSIRSAKANYIHFISYTDEVFEVEIPEEEDFDFNAAILRRLKRAICDKFVEEEK